MNSDFRELLTTLNDCQVKYLVVGGYAYTTLNLADLDGLAVPFISLPDLITAKRTAGREQDLRDIEGLERVLPEQREQ